MDETTQCGNLLAGQDSLYLQQHAHNPVNWLPYSPEAFEKAGNENKLMIISIGYSACHWCHVMEQETFMDTETAALMNERFVCVKVDREERPDVDAFFMESMQLLGIRGGWPLNCIATPKGEPFFGGTYFKKRQWQALLNEVNRVFEVEPELIIEQAGMIIGELKKISHPAGIGDVSREMVLFPEGISKRLANAFDPVEGGLHGAPKFAMPPLLMLCNYLAADENDDLSALVQTTCQKMALSGIYDQIGGGFARYATDERWAVPHFEKMLYDNAQLLSVYSQAWRESRNHLYVEVLEGIHSFLEEWMKHPQLGFFAAVDADSDGGEGFYYTWTLKEFQQILGEYSELFADYFDLNEKGKWEHGRCILQRKYADDSVFTTETKFNPNDFEKHKQQFVARLRSVREMRNPPALDRKIVVSWNALLITGWVDAWKATGAEKFRDSANSLAQGLIKHAFRPDGFLMHCYYGENVMGIGFLEDYAFLAKALLDVYEITGKTAYLEKSGQLIEEALVGFTHAPAALYRFSHHSGDTVPVVRIDETDMVLPSSNAMLCRALVKYAKITGQEEYFLLARQMMRAVILKLAANPVAYGNWGLALAEMQEPWFVVRIAADKYDEYAGILFGSLHHHIVLPEATMASLRPGAIIICGEKECFAPVYSVTDAIKILDNQKV